MRGGKKAGASQEGIEADHDPAAPQEDNSENVPSLSEAEIVESVQYFSHRAMACEFEIYFNDGQYDVSGEAAMQCFDAIDQVESELSVYQADSEISRFNRVDENARLVVGESTFEVLALGREITAGTEHAFDMTAARLSEAWGFSRREGKIPDPASIEQAMDGTGNENWELDPSDHSIVKRHPLTQLNLGAIGKGFSLDKCRSIMKGFGITDYLVHGGNSSVLAGGNRNNVPNPRGWWVGIAHPVLPNRRCGEVRLVHASLSTSGTRRQGFVHRGKWYGHIIDPRNGQPTSGVFSATVICTDSAKADALSTAFYVQGVEWVESFCDKNKDVSVIMLTAKGSGFKIDCFNLEPDDFRQVD